MLSFFEIESEGGDFLAGLGGGHLEHLTGHRLLKSVDASDSVLDLEDGADVLDIELVEVRRLDLAEEYVLDFAGTKDRISGHDLYAQKLGWRVPWKPVRRRDFLACEIYHKLLFGATTDLLEESGRKNRGLEIRARFQASTIPRQGFRCGFSSVLGRTCR